MVTNADGISNADQIAFEGHDCQIGNSEINDDVLEMRCVFSHLLCESHGDWISEVME